MEINEAWTKENLGDLPIKWGEIIHYVRWAANLKPWTISISLRWPNYAVLVHTPLPYFWQWEQDVQCTSNSSPSNHDTWFPFSLRIVFKQGPPRSNHLRLVLSITGWPEIASGNQVHVYIWVQDFETSNDIHWADIKLSRHPSIIHVYIYIYLYTHVFIYIYSLGSLWLYICQAWDTVTLGQSNPVVVVSSQHL